MAKRKTDKEPTFEEAMERLEKIVRDLEEEELPLEKSLSVFEEGVGLSRLLNRKLNEAEEKVEILLRDGKGGKTARPFEAGEEEDAGEEAGDGEDDQGGLPF
jgi:exodeoxyribonuclease VII small subunit